MKHRQWLRLVAGLSLSVSLFAVSAQAQETTIKIGVTAGPHAQIMDFVKTIAAKEDLKLDVIEFSDYVQPNAALAAGDLDANSYQHKPYLDTQIKDRGYKLVDVAYTITFPMGIYSKKFKTVSELPVGARVGIPNDPTNGGRALLLLQAQGVLKLDSTAGLKATPLDIKENPKKLKIIELDAAQLPRSLSDLDAAAVNGNYAASAGLNAVTDAIALEDAKGPYANVIVVRSEDKDKPWVAKLIKAYHNPEVKEFVMSKFKDSVITAW